MVKVTVFSAHRKYRISKAWIVEIIKSVFRRETISRGAINVIFTTDGYIKKINSVFLGHSYPTDVISFRLDDVGPVEGEIYISLDRARIQAKAFGVPFKNEVKRLVVHGTLHLVGYDDREKNDRARMRLKEDYYISHF
jgi:rRNA maturation RNase YbeY